ncbi:MAG: tRNA pseudouridine(38-40) synthase TruA [Clostridiales bacterium]|jgi:tRNA pseudouridine38-40 synthase|nr:tRNA pseudouridine(38-40) synthase TruA [Clostridiales bacterium]
MGILLTIAYDGTNYCGWQEQDNGISICGTLKATLAAVLDCPFGLTGASRTDAGVHALGQRAHLVPAAALKIPLNRLPQVLNSALPKDIAIRAAEAVPDDFHPIWDAKSKTYSYKIHNEPHRNPLIWPYSAFIPSKLDLAAMQEAAQHFVGEHDFAAFCAAGGSAKTTIRKIYFLNIIANGGLLEIRVNGNGFLYNMVRIIAGTLVDVGLGKIKPEDIPDIIRTKKRIKAGKTMPAKGLTLLEIFYA